MAHAIRELSALAEWAPWLSARGIAYHDRAPAATGDRNDPRLSRFAEFSDAMTADRTLIAMDRAGGAARAAAGTLRRHYGLNDGATHPAPAEALEHAEALYLAARGDDAPPPPAHPVSVYRSLP